MINLAKVTEEITSAVSPETTEVETKFYNRLINTAYKQFSNTSFSYIKEDLLHDIQAADTTEQLVNKAQRFIDDRAFISQVCDEKERIDEDRD